MTTQPLYRPLSELDAKTLGGVFVAVRDRAIIAGEAFEYRSWGPEMEARTRVLADPKRAPKVKALAVSEAEWEKMSTEQKLLLARR